MVMYEMKNDEVEVFGDALEYKHFDGELKLALFDACPCTSDLLEIILEYYGPRVKLFEQSNHILRMFHFSFRNNSSSWWSIQNFFTKPHKHTFYRKVRFLYFTRCLTFDDYGNCYVGRRYKSLGWDTMTPFWCGNIFESVTFPDVFRWDEHIPSKTFYFSWKEKKIVLTSLQKKTWSVNHFAHHPSAVILFPFLHAEKSNFAVLIRKLFFQSATSCREIILLGETNMHYFFYCEWKDRNVEKMIFTITLNELLSFVPQRVKLRLKVKETNSKKTTTKDNV